MHPHFIHLCSALAASNMEEGNILPIFPASAMIPAIIAQYGFRHNQNKILSHQQTFGLAKITKCVCSQYTEEKLGKAERTQLDPHLVTLETKTDNMKNLTEKLKNNSAAVLVPNPAARAESLFFDSVPVDKIGRDPDYIQMNHYH